MNPLVFHIASGQAFFSGAALVIVAAIASTRSSFLAKRLTLWALLIGVTAIVLSSTAIGFGWYAAAGVATVAWIATRYFKRWRQWAVVAVVATWALAVVVEIPYHLTPTLEPAASRSIAVIGDSVTAGMGEGEADHRWPQLLASAHQLDVQDLSQMGATAASALKKIHNEPITGAVVLLEIGGNDLLGHTSPAEFSRDLDALLAEVVSPNRQAIMFELPLPPLCHEYGHIQRTLARKHGVALIPKRVFLSVLAENGSTLDTIHLSQAGHEQMAETVWGLVGAAFPNPE